MAKKFSYRGKAIEELREMGLEEFAKLLPSRERRSILRNIDRTLMKRIDRALEEKSNGKEPKPIRTHKREIVILPKMIGLKFAVHKGNTFETFEVQEEMIGHRLGEFALTRKRLVHGKAGIGATKSSTAIKARG